MNKRVIIVIIISLVLIVLGGFVLYLSITGEPGESGDGEAEEGSKRRSLFPFLGDRTRDDSDESSLEDGQDPDGQGASLDGSLPDLRALWNKPVSGIVFGENEGGETIIRFIERGTGHVYETYPTSTKTTRITNSTIPKIQEVLWKSSDQLIIRYLRGDENDTIETFAANIVKPVATGTDNGVSGDLQGQFLPVNLSNVALREDGFLFLLNRGK